MFAQLYNLVRNLSKGISSYLYSFEYNKYLFEDSLTVAIDTYRINKQEYKLELAIIYFYWYFLQQDLPEIFENAQEELSKFLETQLERCLTHQNELLRQISKQLLSFKPSERLNLLPFFINYREEANEKHSNN